MANEYITEKEVILRRMIAAAKQIRSNGQLKRILRKVDASEREAFYNFLADYLSFRPKPYRRLDKWQA